MAITKEQAIEILDFFDFFQGQRAGRELWAEKPYEVQEEDLACFSERISLLKEYIADVVPKSELAREIFEELEQWLGNYNGCRVITYEKFDEFKKKYTEDKK